MEDPGGTRFRLYVQPPFVPGYERPETVWLKARPGSIVTGPANARLYCLDALDKTSPYEFPYLPPSPVREHYPPVRPRAIEVVQKEGWQVRADLRIQPAGLKHEIRVLAFERPATTPPPAAEGAR